MTIISFLVTPIIFDDGKAMHIQPISAHPACRKQCQIGKGISTQVDENKCKFVVNEVLDQKEELFIAS